MMDNQITSDIPKNNWVDRWIPKLARPYIRLARFDRPIGTWLVLFPCWWSLALATTDWSNLYSFLWLMLLFASGAVIMRGAGCCLNDIVDRDFDANVARTKDRPIPAGHVSVTQATIYMMSLCILGLGILIQFNHFTIWLGIASLILVLIYPVTKRFTNWPQLFLGLTFNWGALLGWTTIRGEINLAPIMLYVAGIFWTLGYDTIYALQDRIDDQKVGIKSTALILIGSMKNWLYVFYLFAILFMGISGWIVALSLPFYLGLLLTGSHAIYQIHRLRINDSSDCLSKFKSNRLFGWLFFFSILMGQLF